jgi:hypothetical protein
MSCLCLTPEANTPGEVEAGCRAIGLLTREILTALWARQAKCRRAPATG